MPRHPTPVPESLGDAFGHARAIRAGVSAGRLRTRDLERPFHGTRLRPREPNPPDADPLAIDRAKCERVRRRAEAYSEVMGDHAFFAGMTAAALCGAPLPDDFDADAPLEIATWHPHRAARGRGIHSRQVREHLASVVTRDGLRMSSPASTWAMLGGQLSVRWLVIVGDALVRVPRDDRGHRRPELRLTTPERLRAAALAPGRRHRQHLLDALADIRVGAFSRLETEFRLDAAAAGLPDMELDAEIRDPSGRLLGIADGIHRRYGIVVEIEGDHHRTNRRQWNRDIDRLAAFTAVGWEPVRLTGARVRGGSAVRTVAEALRRHGWEG